MPNHQPRTLAALRASQPLPESIGRHVACARDDRRDIDARVMPAALLILAVGPRDPVRSRVLADQVSRCFRVGLGHVPIEELDGNGAD